MKAKPIILPAPIIRSLPCRQVWVPIRPQPPAGMALHRYYGDDAPRPALARTFGWFVPEAGDLWPCNDEDRIPCPHPPGTLAWVQEAYRRSGDDLPDGIEYDAGKLLVWFDGNEPAEAVAAKKWPRGGAWRSPVTMPRWASRWTLHIEAVAVRRVRNVTVEEARAAGCSVPIAAAGFAAAICPGDYVADERTDFAIRWNRIYGTWDKNPWCWVYTVRAIRANVADVLADPEMH